MAILTTVVGISAGVISVGTLLYGIFTSDGRKIDKLEKRNNEIDAALKTLKDAESKLKNMKTCADKAYSELIDGRDYFLAGGHVNDGKPLASTEFKKIINEVGSIANRDGKINSLLLDVQVTIVELEKEKTKNLAEIQKLAD